MKKNKNSREDLTKPAKLVLSEKDQKTVINFLRNPLKPNQTLIRAFENYRKRLA